MGGYSVNGICYASTQEAVDAYYSNSHPQIIQTPTAVFKVQYLQTAGAWQSVQETVSGSGETTAVTVAPAPVNVYGACSLPNSSYENFSDGQTLGWGVASALTATFAIMLLRKVFP
ncbi:MAG: hypothetical protein V4443_12250 [Pseudomonadota bacterium]